MHLLHDIGNSSSSFQLSANDLSKLSVNLPQEIFNNTNSPTGLAFSVHASSALFPLDDSLRDAGTVVGSPVVGAIVARSEAIALAGLTQPVVVTLPITVKVCYVGYMLTHIYHTYITLPYLQLTEANGSRCVFWNFTAGIHEENRQNS